MNQVKFTMRKFLVIIGCSILLSGCGKLEPLMKKLPFTNEHESVQHKNNTENKNNNEHKKATVGGPLLQAAYFNKIKVADGKKVIQNPDNLLALVNKDFALPESYTPADLVRPNVPFPFGTQKIEKSYIRQEAATALERMFADAKKAGVELYAVSGYRSYARQKSLFDAEVNHVGVEKAEQAVAVPGNSEHQTGLAMDISSPSQHLDLSEAFAKTKEGKWLAQNAHKFGFILRYPKGKESVTVYEFEPWHFRYVGIKAATEIYKRNWTLEEYFKEVRKI